MPFIQSYYGSEVGRGFYCYRLLYVAFNFWEDCTTNSFFEKCLAPSTSLQTRLVWRRPSLRIREQAYKRNGLYGFVRNHINFMPQWLACHTSLPRQSARWWCSEKKNFPRKYVTEYLQAIRSYLTPYWTKQVKDEKIRQGGELEALLGRLHISTRVSRCDTLHIWFLQKIWAHQNPWHFWHERKQPNLIESSIGRFAFERQMHGGGGSLAGLKSWRAHSWLRGSKRSRSWTVKERIWASLWLVTSVAQENSRWIHTKFLAPCGSKLFSESTSSLKSFQSNFKSHKASKTVFPSSRSLMRVARVYTRSKSPRPTISPVKLRELLKLVRTVYLTLENIE